MPSPTTSSPTSNVPFNGTDDILNSLIGGIKWGGAMGTGATLTFSFPWTTEATAVFAGPGGKGDYSSSHEDTADVRFGMDATQQDAVRTALQVWANVANVRFTEVTDGKDSVGDLRFAYSSTADTATTTTGRAVWGYGYYPNNTYPSGGDVWLSSKGSGNTRFSWGAGSYNLGALIHEVGHAMGLKHPFESGGGRGNTTIIPEGWDGRLYTTMSYSFVPGHEELVGFTYTPTTPMLLDIMAMQAIYGANTSYNAGDTVYSFNDSASQYYFQTIWDAGGSNSISYSGNTVATIDLREGHGSTIGNPVYAYTLTNNKAYQVQNVWIAYGVQINQASVSGNGNHTLIGNDNGDRLNGGGGYDKLTGGAGADTLNGGGADDKLEGGAGADVLEGGAGNDTMDGGAGNDSFDMRASERTGRDTMQGGLGDDSYALDDLADKVVENAGEGNDTVWVPFDYSLANLPNVENLRALAVGNGGTTVGLKLTGNDANNLLTGTAGNDVLDGGPGLDTVQFTGSVKDHQVLRGAGGAITVADTRAAAAQQDGSDSLSNVERLRFADQGLAFDMGVSQAAGKTVLMMAATLGSWFPTDKSYAGLFLGFFDSGATLLDGANLLVGAGIVAAFAGGVDNTSVAKFVYGNVYGHAPDAATLAGLVATLSSPGQSQAQWLADMAASSANQATVQLTGYAQTGLAFAV